MVSACLSTSPAVVSRPQRRTEQRSANEKASHQRAHVDVPFVLYLIVPSPIFLLQYFGPLGIGAKLGTANSRKIFERYVTAPFTFPLPIFAVLPDQRRKRSILTEVSSANRLEAFLFL